MHAEISIRPASFNNIINFLSKYLIIIPPWSCGIDGVNISSLFVELKIF